MILFLFKMQVPPQPVSIIREHIQFDRHITILDSPLPIVQLLPHNRAIQVSRQQLFVYNQRLRVILLRALVVTHIRLRYRPVGINVCLSRVNRDSRVVIIHGILVPLHVVVSDTPVHVSMEIIRV